MWILVHSWIIHSRQINLMCNLGCVCTNAYEVRHELTELLLIISLGAVEDLLASGHFQAKTF